MPPIATHRRISRHGLQCQTDDIRVELQRIVRWCAFARSASRTGGGGPQRLGGEESYRECELPIPNSRRANPVAL
jgi:hypothetical protein